EDPNISLIFEKISDELGTHRKECFLVAPDLPQTKINFLISQNIHYINSTGEQLITDLVQNINDHIISDFEKGLTSVETYRKFLANIKLESDIKSNKDGFEIKSLKHSTGKGKGKFELTLRNDPAFIKKFKEHFSEGRLEEFKIPAEQLINTDFRIEGLKLPLPDKQTTIRFEPKPIKTTTIDIRFEDGFEMTDIPIKVFTSKSHVEIHIKIKSVLMYLKLFPGNYPEFQFNFKYIHNELCTTTKEEIEVFTLLKKLVAGDLFTVYPKEGKTFTNVFPKTENFKEELDFYLELFTSLRKIEQYYKIRFSEVKMSLIDDGMVEKINLLMSIVNNTKIEIDALEEFEISEFEVSEENLKRLQAVNQNNAPVFNIYEDPQIIELFGHSFQAGYLKVEYLDPYISNLGEIINKKDQIPILISKQKKALVSFVKDYKK
ncbi:MAG TPA: hypothetical protein PLU49_15010, partial [Saprospiraceae bacterium]|nr:hypothetical protein [Saprospiraceae bacterium]